MDTFMSRQTDTGFLRAGFYVAGTQDMPCRSVLSTQTRKNDFLCTFGFRFFVFRVCMCVLVRPGFHVSVQCTQSISHLMCTRYSLSLASTHQINLSVAFFLFLLYTERVLNLLK